MSLTNELALLLRRYSSEFSDFDGLDLIEANQRGYGDDAPLHVAARHGLAADIDILIKAGASINLTGDLGLTPLHYAAMSGRQDIAKQLLRFGANVQLLNEFGQSAAEVAELGGHADLATFLRSVATKPR